MDICKIFANTSIQLSIEDSKYYEVYLTLLFYTIIIVVFLLKNFKLKLLKYFYPW